MKKLIVIIISFTLILINVTVLNAQVRSDDEIRRPFIPGREQNLF
ncbi:hypothetical protein ACS127_07355 [Amphibacillus sp. Q70]